MQLENMARSGLDYFIAHPFVGLALLAVLVVMAYFRFKLVLKIFFASLILVAIAYLGLFLINLTSSGIDNTEKFLDNPSQTIDRLQ